MDQVKTGKLIRSLRQQKSLTQLALAEMLGVSDKAVSKWERGCGAPDISPSPYYHRPWAWTRKCCFGASWRKTR